MNNFRHLICRNGTWHYRIRIPGDLRAIFGRDEIRRSLKTADRSQAGILARILSGRVREAFALIRQQRLLGLTADQIAAGVQSLLTEKLPVSRQPPLPAGSNRPRDPDLSDAIALFVLDRGAAWEPKTRLMHEAAMRLMQDILANPRVREITRRDARQVRDTMARLPANMSKRWPGKSIGQILALGDPPMSPRTVNKNMGAISALMNWCVREELIADNPARGLTIPIKGRQDAERDAFTRDQLCTLFEQSPLYRGCKSALQRHLPGDQVIRDARFWLPLIALHSGMRLEEIAQLENQDIRRVDGVWCFDIHGKLKTPHSRRLVPVHPALVTLGLLAQGESRTGSLWPELTPGSDGTLSAAFSKWFGRYRRQIGLGGGKLGFHSFRHTAIDALKQAGEQESRIKELVGHKDTSITMARYGKRYRPAVLLETVSRLDYGLDLSHLG